MASWALEDMYPDQETVNDINAVFEGNLALDEFDQKTRDLYLRG